MPSDSASDATSLQPTGLLPAMVLLLLKERPGHGYELVERVKAAGVQRSQRAVYSAARLLEQEGLLRATFEFPGRGPARRVLTVTPAGDETLARFADGVDRLRGLVNELLDRQRAVFEEPAGTGPRRRRRARRNPAA